MSSHAAAAWRLNWFDAARAASGNLGTSQSPASDTATSAADSGSSLPTNHPYNHDPSAFSLSSSSAAGARGADAGSSAAMLSTTDLSSEAWRMHFLASFLMPSGITVSVQLPPW